MAEFDKVKYNNDFNAKTYDRLNIVVPKGQKAIIQEHAKSLGKSHNSYVVDLINSDLKSDDSSPTSTS